MDKEFKKIITDNDLGGLKRLFEIKKFEINRNNCCSLILSLVNCEDIKILDYLFEEKKDNVFFSLTSFQLFIKEDYKDLPMMYLITSDNIIHSDSININLFKVFPGNLNLKDYENELEKKYAPKRRLFPFANKEMMDNICAFNMTTIEKRVLKIKEDKTIARFIFSD